MSSESPTETAMITANSTASRSRDQRSTPSTPTTSSGITISSWPSSDRAQNWRAGEARPNAGPKAWSSRMNRQFATDSSEAMPSPARARRCRSLEATRQNTPATASAVSVAASTRRMRRGPERPHVDARTVAPLGQEPGHREEPGQREQRRHPEVAALGPRQVRVEEQHHDDGEALEAVERGERRQEPAGVGPGDPCGWLRRIGRELQLDPIGSRIGTRIGRRADQRLDVGERERRAGADRRILSRSLRRRVSRPSGPGRLAGHARGALLDRLVGRLDHACLSVRVLPRSVRRPAGTSGAV